MTQRPDLIQKILYIKNIPNIIRKSIKFENTNPEKKDIIKYLQEVNGYLTKPSKYNIEEVKNHYITAVNIYIFDPLLDLNLNSEKVKNNFKTLAYKKFNKDNPFELYPPQRITEDTKAENLIKITEDLIKVYEPIKSTKSYKKKIEESLSSLTTDLLNDYNLDLHCSFIGNYDIFAPIFNIKKFKPNIVNMAHMLNDNKGSFFITLPDYFIDE